VLIIVPIVFNFALKVTSGCGAEEQNRIGEAKVYGSKPDKLD
jgi:hypothetical protein